MAEYLTNEASFEPPEGWDDGSVNVLRPEGGRDDLKLVILRVPQKGASLDEFVAYQKKDLLQRTPWFTVLAEEERLVDGQRALALRATYKDAGVPLYQRRVTFAGGDKFVTLIVAGAASIEAECDALLERVAGSVRLRQRA